MNRVQNLVREPILWVAVAGFVLPLFISGAYNLQLTMMCVVYAILACSLNISVGMAGLSNLAHAAFFGIGAYATALLNYYFGVPWYVTVFCGGALAAVFGFLLGLPTLRLKGVYLALGTSAFGSIIRIIEINWTSVTRGSAGIPGIEPISIAGQKLSKLQCIYLVMVILILCMYMIKRIMKSKMGRALFAIRYDETAARSIGVNTTRYKIYAYVISSCVAGLTGALYANYISFISPETFTPADSTTVLCMVILGGSGTLLGPVLGAVFLTLAPEVLRFADLWRLIFVGVVMVVGVIYNFSGANDVIASWFQANVAVKFQKKATVPQNRGE